MAGEFSDNPDVLGAHRKHPPAMHMIEGERYTMEQIAARLGIKEDAARSRLKREQSKPGRVTWAGLASLSKRRPAKNHPWKNSPPEPADRSRPLYAAYSRRGVAE